MHLTITASSSKILHVGQKVALSNNGRDLRILIPENSFMITLREPSFHFHADEDGVGFTTEFDIRGYIMTPGEDLFEFIRISVK